MPFYPPPKPPHAYPPAWSDTWRFGYQIGADWCEWAAKVCRWNADQIHQSGITPPAPAELLAFFIGGLAANAATVKVLELLITKLGERAAYAAVESWFLAAVARSSLPAEEVLARSRVNLGIIHSATKAAAEKAALAGTRGELLAKLWTALTVGGAFGTAEIARTLFGGDAPRYRSKAEVKAEVAVWANAEAYWHQQHRDWLDQLNKAIREGWADKPSRYYGWPEMTWPKQLHFRAE